MRNSKKIPWDGWKVVVTPNGFSHWEREDMNASAVARSAVIQADAQERGVESEEGAGSCGDAAVGEGYYSASVGPVTGALVPGARSAEAVAEDRLTEALKQNEKLRDRIKKLSTLLSAIGCLAIEYEEEAFGCKGKYAYESMASDTKDRQIEYYRGLSEHYCESWKKETECRQGLSSPDPLQA